jgi:hypothetical protein
MDDVDIALTFQISDIKDPQKRHADFSKTITVPGSHNNNKMFQHIFDVGIDRLYNPNKKANCVLMADSTAIMKGYMRLKNIITVDKKISYEIEITGRLADLFTILGDSKLRDLTWSDLDHTYSRANQIASWSGTIGSNYLYPFIDYGFTLNEIDYEVNHFFPAVYFKEIWDRIMMWAGFQISSPNNFFTSSPFKNLILPFNSDKLRLTTAQIDARRFQASRTSAAFYPQSLGGGYQYTDIVFNNDSTLPNIDSGGVYNTATGIWTCGTSGFYTVTSNINCRTRATISAAAGGYISMDTIFRMIDITNTIPTVNQYSQLQLMPINTTATGTTYYPYTITFNMSTNANAVYVPAGTQVKVQAMMQCAQVGTATVTNFGVEIDPGSVFFTKVDPEIKEGDTVVMENALPDMKMADFVNGVIKAFNIYTEYDKDVPNKLIMEPRNTFYQSTTQDWTQKRDLSRELEIVPMGALQARYYNFTYKEDKDYYNAKYLNENGEVYGRMKVTVDNDFLKNTYNEELPFSPSPIDSSSAKALNVPIVSNSDRYFPKIISVDDKGKVTPKVSNPRMLYYGGLKQCKPWNYKSLALLSTSGVTHYPFVGHMDDPITPTLDLNFGLTKEVYYEPAFNATISDNNLFNVYWKQEIEEITNKNSSIVAGWFHLTAKDIAMLNFRHVYRFDFQNFRLNKVYDYNPLKDGPTKCEFIKIKDGVPFVYNTTGILGSVNNLLAGAGLPVPKPKKNTGYNPVGGGVPIGNIISGRFNSVPISATGIIITGDNNTVGDNARNVTILNSSGCVVPGNVSEVFILNSSGVTVNTNNTSVINNIVQYSQSTGAMSGEYTPIVGATSNVTTAEVQNALWSRVGNIVTVSGHIGIDPIAPATLTQINLSLPIVSNLVNFSLAGTMTSGTAAGMGGYILADGTQSLMRFISSDISQQGWCYTYQYKII